MFNLLLVIQCFCICVFSLNEILATTSEEKVEIHAHFEEIGETCLKENHLTEEDLISLRDHDLPSGPHAPCFLACIMKRIGLMNDSGYLKQDAALEKAKVIFDEEEIKSLEDNLKSCSHVNNEAVSDGEKGCERAILAIKCLSEDEFNFDV